MYMLCTSEFVDNSNFNQKLLNIPDLIHVYFQLLLIALLHMVFTCRS